MAVKTFILRVNADETITVRMGRQVEHITMIGKTEYEQVEAIRWALITMGAMFSWSKVHDVLLEEKAR